MGKKRVVVFGIFDGVHEGHRDFFRQARAHGDELVVVVGRDEASMHLKNKKPRHSQEERLRLVRQEQEVKDAVLGDEVQSRYDVLEQLDPDVICLGYDQDALWSDLVKWIQDRNKAIQLVKLQPCKV